MAIFEKHDSGEFHGSLVVRTQGSLCQEPEFEIWLGDSDPVSHAMWPPPQKKNKKQKHTHKTKTTTFWAAEKETCLMYQFTTDSANLNE